jgi:hypothetical protein
MASSGERRMLFDTRGKRKHVIRVVYAILALLMGASLFLVVGPFNLASILGNSSSTTSSAAKVLHEQAERIEGRLVKSPDDEQLLLALTRARINAGNAQIEQEFASETPTVTPEAKKDFVAASESWGRYLKVAAEPSPTGAQLVASTYFRQAEGSATVKEAQENVTQAAKAQRIAAEQHPNLGSLSTLAIYEYYAGNFAAGDKATKQAAAEAGSKAEAKGIEKQLAEFRKRGEAFAKQKKETAKLESEASKKSLENPFGGFGAGAPGG